MNVVLIGNYAKDRQESMLRFGDLLKQELSSRGVGVRWMQPTARCGGAETGSAFINKWLAYVDKLLLFPRDPAFQVARNRGSSTVVHICDHSNGFYVPRLRNAKTVVTCHDLLAVRSARGEIPENPTSVTGRYLQEMILKGLNQASRVVCVSEQTRRDLLRLTSLQEHQVKLVPNGLNHSYSPMEAITARAKVVALLERRGIPVPTGNDLHRGCILHVGGNSWYKNRPTVVRIYERLVELMPEAPPLIMVGRPLPGFWRSWIEARKLGSRIHVIDSVANEDLRALYSWARVLLFPSLAEGFGWPIIEAHACGCPVVTTPLPPMREVGGDAALYANPHNYKESAMVLRQLLRASTETLSTLRQRSLANAERFTTAKMMEGYLAVYEELLQDNVRHPKGALKRT